MIAGKSPTPIMRHHHILGRGARAAAHRPRCVRCGETTHLFRIAPGANQARFQVEYTFECACGEMLVIDEADLSPSRA
jgi:hypothetical protein